MPPRELSSAQAYADDSKRDDGAILIVGAGIGGLALARALQLHGLKSVLFERDAAFDERAQGYGLTMQQGGRALDALGLAEAVTRASITSSSHCIFDANGRLLLAWGWRLRSCHLEVDPSASTGDSTVDNGPKSSSSTSGQVKFQAEEQDEPTTSTETSSLSAATPMPPSPSHSESTKTSPTQICSGWTSARNGHIPRQRLRRVLFDSLDHDYVTVVWGATILDIDVAAIEKNNISNAQDVVPTICLKLASTNGANMHVYGRAIIGCDGIHSIVRRLAMKPQAPLRYLDTLVVLGIVPYPAPLFVDRVVQVSDGATRIFAMPFDDERCMWQLSYFATLDEAQAVSKAGADALKAAVIKRCARWPETSILKMLEATDPSLITGYPVYDRDPVETFEHVWENAAITILGDAAHPMSPFKGQGANQALIDAVALSQAIARVEGLLPGGRPKKSKKQKKKEDAMRKRAGRPGGDPEARDANEAAEIMAINEPPVNTLSSAFRAHERLMQSRSRGKVLGSRSAAQTLHHPDFIDTRYQLQRRGFAPAQSEAILRLTAARPVGTWSSLDELDAVVGDLASVMAGDFSCLGDDVMNE